MNRAELAALISSTMPPQHSSTAAGVRARPPRSYSYLPQVKTPEIVTPAVGNSRRTRKSMRADIEEPEFVREEREAWSRKSPKTDTDMEVRATRVRNPNLDIVLQPPTASDEPTPQPRKQAKPVLPLREFGPVDQEGNIEERPKTSRGLSSSGEEDVGLRSSEDSQDNAAIEQNTRRSRFLEGSLTERSAAVASSWYGHEPVSEDSYESDLIPSDSRDMRDSFESIENRPLPLTPATVKKKKLSKLKSSIKTGYESETATEQQEIPQKKGLRKSLSMWNFHQLGDKMRRFGGSTNDLTPKAPKPDKDPNKLSKTAGRDAAKDVLDERKRKAEEAYSQQFGLKKQKSNSGIANSTRPPQASVATKPSSMKRRTPSSSRAPSSSSRNRVPPSSVSLTLVPDHSPNDLDNSKRPSREELEKENRHLRMMLRQSSSTQLDAHRSSLHLALDEAASQENIARLSQEDFAQGHKMCLSTGKRIGRRREDIPPVPKLSREVLSSWENGCNARGAIDGKGKLPRPVSMILEEEENNNGSDEVNIAKNGDFQMSSVKEKWEWPEDVF